MTTLSISNLSIGYKDKVVAEGLTADIRGGELTALVGANGTGKSTLLRTLAGLQPALRGEIVLMADDRRMALEGLSGQALSRMVSVVLTEQPALQNTTAEELVAYGRMPYTGFFGRLSGPDRDIVAQAMRLTGITPLRHRLVETLSDGERQKVMIAKALAQRTPVILLDEPTAFLDYPSKVETLRLLAGLAHDMGKLIMLSTHDLGLVSQLADRLLTIDHGLREVSHRQLTDYMSDLLSDNDTTKKGAPIA